MKILIVNYFKDGKISIRKWLEGTLFECNNEPFPAKILMNFSNPAHQ